MFLTGKNNFWAIFYLKIYKFHQDLICVVKCLLRILLLTFDNEEKILESISTFSTTDSIARIKLKIERSTFSRHESLRERFARLSNYRQSILPHPLSQHRAHYRERLPIATKILLIIKLSQLGLRPRWR